MRIGKVVGRVCLTSPYETLVGVMGTVRGTLRVEGPHTIRTELFPNISIGDAPVAKK